MAGLTERLAIIVDANTRGAVRGMDQLGRSSKSNLGQADKGIQKFTQSMRTSLPVIGAVGAAGAAAFASLSSSAAEASSVMGAMDRVFGSAGSGMQQFAKDAEALGLSQVEAGRAATLLGGQLASLGVSQAQASEKAKELVERAADLSVGFGTTQDAVTGISAILRNEFDTIEKFAVSLKKSDINARLAAKELDGLTGEALKNAEAIAALELLMEKTANRAGAWGDDSNKAARSQAELRASIENLQVEIGQNLLPAFTETVDALNAIVDTGSNAASVIAQVADAASSAVPDVGSLANKLGPLGSILTGLGQIGGAAGDFFTPEHSESLERSMNAIATGEQVVGRVSGAFGTMADAIFTTGDAAEESADKYESLLGPLLNVDGALSDIDDRSSGAAIAHRSLSDAQRQQVEAARSVADAQMGVAEAMAATFDATDAARRAVSDYAAEQRAAIDPVFAMVRALEKQEDLLRGPRVIKDSDGKVTRVDVGASPMEVAEGAAAVEQAGIGLAGAIQNGTTSVEQARATLDRYRRQGLITADQFEKLSGIIEEAAGAAVTLEGSTVDQAIASEVAAEAAEFEAEKAQNVREARERLETANQRYAAAQDRVRDATRQVIDAQDDAVRKADALDQAMFELNKQVQDNPGFIADAKAKLDDWVQRGIIPANEAASTFERLIDNINTALAQFAGSDYLATLVSVLDQVSVISGESPILNASPRARDQILDGTRAHGGPVTSGGTYLVGERGPELFSPGTSGFVFNNDDTRRMGNRTNYSVVVNNYGPEDGVERGLRELHKIAYRTRAR